MNPLPTFFTFMAGNNPDQMHLGEAARLFSMMLYWLLLATSIAVACWNLCLDKSQRTVAQVGVTTRVVRRCPESVNIRATI